MSTRSGDLRRLGNLVAVGTASLAVHAIVGGGCGGGVQERPPETVAPPDTAPLPGPIVHKSGDAPEISRSVGSEGGAIVLWPRIVPRSETGAAEAIARGLQERLRNLVERTLPGAPIDMRPAPERVCPRAGCTAFAAGALLLKNQGGCIVLALVSAPGTAPSELVPWVGHVELRQRMVPFREPPEAEVRALDFQRCDAVLEGLDQGESAVMDAIRAVAPSP